MTATHLKVSRAYVIKIVKVFLVFGHITPGGISNNTVGRLLCCFAIA